ncbi:hypothetical protein RJG79_09110 [Mycoplasmatota bacterium WC44]
MENKDDYFDEKIKNNIEKILHFSGFLVLFITFFGGLLFGAYFENFIIRLSTWLSGFISGILLISLGVIVDLLKSINEKSS